MWTARYMTPSCTTGNVYYRFVFHAVFKKNLKSVSEDLILDPRERFTESYLYKVAKVLF